MVKRGFKMGGNSRTVAVVADVDSDAGAAPAVDGGVASVRPALPTQAEQEAGGAATLETPVLTADGWTTDARQVAWYAEKEAMLTAPEAIPAGWDVIEGGVEGTSLDADNGAGGTVAVDVLTLTQEPDVMWVQAGLRADDDGMGQMHPIMNSESVVVTDVVLPDGYVPGDASVWGELGVAMPVEASGTHVTPAMEAGYAMGDWTTDADDAALDVVASEPVAAGAIGTDEQGRQWGVVAAPVVPSLGEIEAQAAVEPSVTVEPIRLALDISALDLARFIGGATVELTFGGVVIGTMQPAGGNGGGGKRGKAPKAAKVATNGAGATPAAPKPARDWLAFDGQAQWGASDTPWARGYVKVWTAIRDAANRMDLDTLRAFDFAGAREDGSGNSFSKSNGAYLRAQIARVEAGQAALDAEFGIASKLAAD